MWLFSFALLGLIDFGIISELKNPPKKKWVDRQNWKKEKRKENMEGMIFSFLVKTINFSII